LLWIALLLLPAGLAPQRVIRWYFRRLVQASGCRVHVRGLEYLRRSGPAVLVLNHQSYVDGAVVVAALPTGFRFLLKRQLEAYPLIGTAVRKCGHLLVDRASWDDRLAAADRLVDALRRGDSILVFPESTLARGPALLPFRLGAFRAAVESGCPVIPIAVRGTREILPQGRWLLRRGVVHVTIGEPIEAKGEGWRESLDVRCRARAAIERDLSAASAGNGAAGV
jgi:1-acyl-sn-glycerol-3-phosphate acyltransferase